MCARIRVCVCARASARHRCVCGAAAVRRLRCAWSARPPAADQRTHHRLTSRAEDCCSAWGSLSRGASESAPTRLGVSGGAHTRPRRARCRPLRPLLLTRSSPDPDPETRGGHVREPGMAAANGMCVWKVYCMPWTGVRADRGNPEVPDKRQYGIVGPRRNPGPPWFFGGCSLVEVG